MHKNQDSFVCLFFKVHIMRAKSKVGQVSNVTFKSISKHFLSRHFFPTAQTSGSKIPSYWCNVWELSLTYVIRLWFWVPGKELRQAGELWGEYLTSHHPCCSLVQGHTEVQVGINRARGIFILTLAWTLQHPPDNYSLPNIRTRTAAFCPSAFCDVLSLTALLFADSSANK